MREIGLNALLISDIVNVQWISGFTGSSGVVVVTPGTGHFITDGRYDIQAKQQVSELEVHIFGGNLTQQDMIASVFADASAKHQPSATERFAKHAQKCGAEAVALRRVGWTKWSRPRAPKADGTRKVVWQTQTRDHFFQLYGLVSWGLLA
jgi:Xaa-Pro aminopeptidase